MRTARTVEIAAVEFCRHSGRAQLRFRIDGWEHVVHALFHDAPDLPPEVWQGCLEELALACAADFATATMAREVSSAFDPGPRALAWFFDACQALRLEVLFDARAPLLHLPVRFRPQGRAGRFRRVSQPDPNRVLLLMGGGKDSLYAFRLLQQAGCEVHCFYLTEVSRTWQQLRRVHSALAPETVQYRVYLDANCRGPIDRRYGDQYLSQFQVGQLIGACLPYALGGGYRYIALGLEKSSDEAMATYCGHEVNHQHQKSTGFVRVLNRDLQWRFHNSLSIVSPVKGLYEFGIYARLLYAAPHLVELQSSCGGANSRSPHCGRCHKCAFLAALLAALTSDRQLHGRLFPCNPLDDPSLYQDWLDDSRPRPLTCAGLKEEVRIALCLARARGWDLTALDGLAGHGSDDHRDARVRYFLASHPNSLLPPALRAKLGPHLRVDWRQLLGSRFGQTDERKPVCAAARAP